MPITSYATLQTAIGDWMMGRTDVLTNAPDFISMAETWMTYGADDTPPLRTLEMETVETITPVAGVAPLPTGFLEYLAVTPNTGSRIPLDYLTPDEASRRYTSSAGGYPRDFTIIGANLYTYPTDNGPLSLRYYKALPALSTSNTSNWLLAKSPLLYLRASLAQAAEWVKDDEEASKQFQLARGLLAGLNMTAVMARYGRTGRAVNGPTP